MGEACRVWRGGGVECSTSSTRTAPRLYSTSMMLHKVVELCEWIVFAYVFTASRFQNEEESVLVVVVVDSSQQRTVNFF